MQSLGESIISIAMWSERSGLEREVAGLRLQAKVIFFTAFLIFYDSGLIVYYYREGYLVLIYNQCELFTNYHKLCIKQKGFFYSKIIRCHLQFQCNFLERYFFNNYYLSAIIRKYFNVLYFFCVGYIVYTVFSQSISLRVSTLVFQFFISFIVNQY